MIALQQKGKLQVFGTDYLNWLLSADFIAFDLVVMQRYIRANEVHLRVSKHSLAMLTLLMNSSELMSPLVDIVRELNLAYAIVDI